MAEQTPEESADRVPATAGKKAPPERGTLRTAGLFRAENAIFVVLGIAAIGVLSALIWLGRH
ncbi:hypothetical protein [Methylobacterium nigriterrae]|uniref:hypothetical protein n=1 Tax=Methylobacterium nigriterrae TaxID=3127512 RepID=UPI003013958F